VSLKRREEIEAAIDTSRKVMSDTIGRLERDLDCLAERNAGLICKYLLVWVCVCNYVCVFIYVSVCVYVLVCVYVCMCVCMYVCKYVCIYVCVYVCIYVCIYVCVCRELHPPPCSMFHADRFMFPMCVCVCMCVCMYV
jgi:hypothetical protein